MDEESSLARLMETFAEDDSDCEEIGNGNEVCMCVHDLFCRWFMCACGLLVSVRVAWVVCAYLRVCCV